MADSPKMGQRLHGFSRSLYADQITCMNSTGYIDLGFVEMFGPFSEFITASEHPQDNGWILALTLQLWQLKHA